MHYSETGGFGRSLIESPASGLRLICRRALAALPDSPRPPARVYAATRRITATTFPCTCTFSAGTMIGSIAGFAGISRTWSPSR